VSRTVLNGERRSSRAAEQSIAGKKLLAGGVVERILDPSNAFELKFLVSREVDWGGVWCAVLSP
jgi:hypothetical protein